MTAAENGETRQLSGLSEFKVERRMSPHGRALLAKWEGLRLREYADAAGLPTIGIGHLLSTDEVRSGMVRIGDRHVTYSAGITEDEAMELLDEDLRRFEHAVETFIVGPLDQSQFDALVSFAFNVGVANFRNSTLVRRVNEGRRDDVPMQLRKWVNAAGHRLQGLVNRRENEILLWEGRL